VKGIITVKWISYGWRYMALLLAEHLLFMAFMVTYLVLIIDENQVCSDTELVGGWQQGCRAMVSLKGASTNFETLRGPTIFIKV